MCFLGDILFRWRARAALQENRRARGAGRGAAVRAARACPPGRLPWPAPAPAPRLRTASDTPLLPDTRSLRFSSSAPLVGGWGWAGLGDQEGWGGGSRAQGSRRRPAGARGCAARGRVAGGAGGGSGAPHARRGRRPRAADSPTAPAPPPPAARARARPRPATHARSCSASSACASEVSLAALEAPVLKLWREESPDSLMAGRRGGAARLSASARDQRDSRSAPGRARRGKGAVRCVGAIAAAWASDGGGHARGARVRGTRRADLSGWRGAQPWRREGGNPYGVPLPLQTLWARRGRGQRAVNGGADGGALAARGACAVAIRRQGRAPRARRAAAAACPAQYAATGVRGARHSPLLSRPTWLAPPRPAAARALSGGLRLCWGSAAPHKRGAGCAAGRRARRLPALRRHAQAQRASGRAPGGRGRRRASAAAAHRRPTRPRGASNPSIRRPNHRPRPPNPPPHTRSRAAARTAH
jgi:hypothetical protein